MLNYNFKINEFNQYFYNICKTRIFPPQFLYWLAINTLVLVIVNLSNILLK